MTQQVAAIIKKKHAWDAIPKLLYLHIPDCLILVAWVFRYSVLCEARGLRLQFLFRPSQELPFEDGNREMAQAHDEGEFELDDWIQQLTGYVQCLSDLIMHYQRMRKDIMADAWPERETLLREFWAVLGYHPQLPSSQALEKIIPAPASVKWLLMNQTPDLSREMCLLNVNEYFEPSNYKSDYKRKKETKEKEEEEENVSSNKKRLVKFTE